MSKTPLCALFAAMAAMTVGAVRADVELTPADDLQAAIDKAEVGETLTLLPGEYLITRTITLSKGITVKGIHRDFVQLVANGSGFNLVKLTNADAVLSEVTVRGVTGNEAAVVVTAGSFEDSVVRNNSANGRNGNVYLNGTSAYMRRTVLYGNKDQSYYGGGCWLSAGTVANCLFYGNYASWGGGIYAPDSGTRRVVNCTLVGNTAAAAVNGYDICWWTQAPNMSNCAMNDFVANVNAPNKSCYALNDHAGGTVCTIVDSLGLGADYAPVEGSPLIDAGIAVDENIYLDGSLHGETPTVGCYPPPAERITASVASSTRETVAKGDTVRLDFAVANASAGARETLTVYNQQGVVETFDVSGRAEGSVDLTVSAYGWYYLVLRVEDGDRRADAALDKAFLCGVNHLYVDANSKAPTLPYDSWETASHDLATALAAAADEGCTITVADGTYVLPSELIVSKAVVIESAHGADLATLTTEGATGVRPLRINNAAAVVRGFTIANGRGAGGGGVLFGANGGTLDACIVEDCVATGHGGGIYLRAGATVSRTIVRRCSTSGSTYYGGCAYFDNGGVAVNSLFFGGSSSYGANIYTEGAGGALVNCTAGRCVTGYSFYNYSQGFTATNCALYSATWNTVRPEGPKVRVTTGTELGWLDAASGDYSLKPTSQLVDAGSDLVLDTVAVDLIGTARPVGEHIDIGCYEYFDRGFECVIDASSSSATAGGGAVTFTPTVTGAQGTPTCSWRLENLAGGETITGETVGSGAAGAFKVSFKTPGYYRVRATVTDGGRSVEAKLSSSFPVRAAGAFYVSKTGKAVPPYDSWENATTNLPAAVSMAASGSTVNVDAGEWTVSSTLSIGAGIRLCGAGIGSTVLRTGAKSLTGVLYLYSPSAVVSGVTVTATLGSGFSGTGGGVNISSGLLENSRVTGCTAEAGFNGIAVNLSGADSRMSHCIIDGNRGRQEAGYGCVHATSGAKIDNCLFFDNYAKWGGCLYIDTGAGGGKVTNCTFYAAKGGQEWGVYNMRPAGACLVNSVLACTYEDYQNSKTPGEGYLFNCASRTELFGEDGVVDALAFVDPANGNFHLPDNSKCRGRGLYADWMRKTTDLDGKRRAPGGVVDIGCYRVGRNGLMLLVR